MSDVQDTELVEVLLSQPRQRSSSLNSYESFRSLREILSPCTAKFKALPRFLRQEGSHRRVRSSGVLSGVIGEVEMRRNSMAIWGSPVRRPPGNETRKCSVRARRSLRPMDDFHSPHKSAPLKAFTFLPEPHPFILLRPMARLLLSSHSPSKPHTSPLPRLSIDSTDVWSVIDGILAGDRMTDTSVDWYFRYLQAWRHAATATQEAVLIGSTNEAADISSSGCNPAIRKPSDVQTWVFPMFQSYWVLVVVHRSAATIEVMDPKGRGDDLQVVFQSVETRISTETSSWKRKLTQCEQQVDESDEAVMVCTEARHLVMGEGVKPGRAREAIVEDLAAFALLSR